MAEYLFPLKDRKEVADQTMAFWFDTTGSGFTFEAGQNCDFMLIDPPIMDDKGTGRTFSIVNSPNVKDSIMITTRMRDSAFKNFLKTCPFGTKVKVVGPLGDMTLHENATKPAVFLAGGIGITPFHSMIAWATEQKLSHDITLFYSNRTKAAAPFLDELETWTQQNLHFKLVATMTDEPGPTGKYLSSRIDQALIEQYVPDLTKPIYYVAGPQSMAIAMKDMLKAAGVSKDNIRSEEFTGY